MMANDNTQQFRIEVQRPDGQIDCKHAPQAALLRSISVSSFSRLRAYVLLSPGARGLEEAHMHARKWILAFGLVLATVPAAGAVLKDPAPGSVSCYCSCKAKDANGADMNYNKIVGGTEGTWSQSRGACQAFTGSSCTAKDGKGNWHTGELQSCDTHVHSARGSNRPQAPAADTLAPAPETPDGGTNRLKLRLKQQRVTQ